MQDIHDPWPMAGSTNAQWADQLLTVILSPDSMPFEDRLGYLARALDIACMNSERPIDRELGKLIEKFDEAIAWIEEHAKPEDSAFFVMDCVKLLDRVRSVRGG